VPRDWPFVSARPLAHCRIFDVWSELSVEPRTGAERERFVLTCPDWVNVIALTTAEEVVLIEQFRHGTRAVTLEIPGGTIDDGEDALTAGLRELREETGFGGGRATLLGSCEPNPAIQRNRCWFLLVEGAERLGPPCPGEGEDIEVSHVPLSRVREHLASGRIAHALVLAAFQRYFAWREGAAG
jgi:ADP-ribose pyrophosphatase